jgi:hypothetical protein
MQNPPELINFYNALPNKRANGLTRALNKYTEARGNYKNFIIT